MQVRATSVPCVVSRRSVRDFCERLCGLADERLVRPAYTERFVEVYEPNGTHVRSVRTSGNAARAAGFKDSSFTPADVAWARKTYAEVLLGVDEGSRSRMMRFALITTLVPGVPEMVDLLHLALAVKMGCAPLDELADRVAEHGDTSVARWSDIGDHARKIGEGEAGRLPDDVILETFRTYMRTGSYEATAADLGLTTGETIRLRLEIGEARGLFPRLDRSNTQFIQRLAAEHLALLVSRHGAAKNAAKAIGVSSAALARALTDRGIPHTAAESIDISPTNPAFDAVVERLNPRHLRLLTARHGSARGIAHALCVGTKAVTETLRRNGFETSRRKAARATPVGAGTIPASVTVLRPAPPTPSAIVAPGPVLPAAPMLGWPEACHRVLLAGPAEGMGVDEIHAGTRALGVVAKGPKVSQKPLLMVEDGLYRLRKRGLAERCGQRFWRLTALGIAQETGKIVGPKNSLGSLGPVSP